MSRIWITWERHRRSRGLSSAFNAQLHEICVPGNALRRYFLSGLRTVQILMRSRGARVFVQSPSIVLALLATITCRLTGSRVIIDAHNGGVTPLEGKSKALVRIAQLALRWSDLVIVTNSGLANHVKALNPRVAVLIDPMPNLAQIYGDPNVKKRTSILAICTWASDEPFLELIAAAPMLPPRYELVITGRPKLSEAQLAQLPENVRLAGFVSEEEYVQLLRSCDVAVDLTSREDCLVCGAYESISAHKPLVVSGTNALRDLLADAAIYCTNDARSIAAAIRTAVDSIGDLQRKARARDKALRIRWTQEHERVEMIISQLSRP